jgi:hypothetical protein
MTRVFYLAGEVLKKNAGWKPALPALVAEIGSAAVVIRGGGQ